jgi:hypothetical protein
MPSAPVHRFARYNASREVRDIVEGRTLAGDNHVGQQRIL